MDNDNDYDNDNDKDNEDRVLAANLKSLQLKITLNHRYFVLTTDWIIIRSFSCLEANWRKKTYHLI